MNCNDTRNGTSHTPYLSPLSRIQFFKVLDKSCNPVRKESALSTFLIALLPTASFVCTGIGKVTVKLGRHLSKDQKWLTSMARGTDRAHRQISGACCSSPAPLSIPCQHGGTCFLPGDREFGLGYQCHEYESQL